MFVWLARPQTVPCSPLAVWLFVVVLLWVTGLDGWQVEGGRYQCSVSGSGSGSDRPVTLQLSQHRRFSLISLSWENSSRGAGSGRGPEERGDWRWLRISHIYISVGAEDESLFYVGHIWKPIYYIGSDFPLRSRNIFCQSIGKFQFWSDLKISWYFPTRNAGMGQIERQGPWSAPLTGADWERQLAFNWLNFQL